MPDTDHDLSPHDDHHAKRRDGGTIDVSSWAHRTRLALPIAKLIAWIVVPVASMVGPLIWLTWDAIKNRFEAGEQERAAIHAELNHNDVNNALRDFRLQAHDKAIEANRAELQRAVNELKTEQRAGFTEIKTEIRELAK